MIVIVSILIQLTSITCVILCIQACISLAPFNIDDNKINEKRIWDEVTSKRLLADCDCGQGGNDQARDKPWNVFIHLKTAPTLRDKICTGTIISSNLVITSHKCLTLKDKDKTMNIYDFWRPKAGKLNMLGKDRITVTEKINKSSGEIFRVEEIIYNSDYALTSAHKNLSSSDIVLIRLAKDFTGHTTKLRPICIPSSHFKQTDIINQRAIYYGAARLDDTNPINEVRKIDNGIQKGVDCSNDSSVTDETVDNANILCVVFEGILPDATPEMEGGPLLVNSGASAFLVGIATKVLVSENVQGVDYDLAFFTNIIPWIKYLEYKANKYGSKWCKSPTLQLDQKIMARPLQGGNGPRPWESLTSSAGRDSSLDCVCGVLNDANKLSGRVAGGKSATPYEFGWMTLLGIHVDGKVLGCGGSIINDRVILTAAHCVITDGRIKSGSKELRPLPGDIDVTVNVHLRRGDSNGIAKRASRISFHPGYPIGRNDSPRYYDYDVALIVLKQPLQFPTSTLRGIRPVCLPKLEEKMPVIGKTATVAGWGLMNPVDEKSFADELQKLEIPIIELSKCRDVARAKVTDRNLCAGSLNRLIDAGSGDSGGPLITKYDNDKWYKVGIVSWGQDVRIGNEIKTAALYTDVQNADILKYIDYESQRVKAKWCKQ